MYILIYQRETIVCLGSWNLIERTDICLFLTYIDFSFFFKSHTRKIILLFLDINYTSYWNILHTRNVIFFSFFYACTCTFYVGVRCDFNSAFNVSRHICRYLRVQQIDRNWKYFYMYIRFFIFLINFSQTLFFTFLDKSESVSLNKKWLWYHTKYQFYV